jgi:FOG: WD40-like repeat
MRGVFRSKNMRLLTLALWIGYAGLFSASILSAADVPFDQGTGYESGAYDPDAGQPTAWNWTRQSRFKVSAVHPQEKWSYETGDMLESSPAIGTDGTIYVGSNDGRLYALDAHASSEADRVKWSYETGGRIVSAPAIGADGIIYAGSYDGTLYALNPNAAGDADRVKWRFDTGDWIASSPAIGADGTIYVGSYDGKLYALDSYAAHDDDRLQWSYDLGDWIVSSPAIDADGTIYAGSYDGTLYALNPNAAGDADRVKWLYDTGLVIEASPAIGADGTVYIGSYDGKLYALDPDAASDADRLKWFYETGNAIVSSPAIGLDGTIYTGSSDGKLYALHPHAAGDADRVKWSYQTEDGIRSSPVVDADSTIYAGSYDGKLYALNPHAADEAERVKWSYQTEGEIRSSPAIGADGTIYVGSLDRKLYALGAAGLSVPDEVTAIAGEGAVQLEWRGVDGAAGYRIYLYQGSAAPDDPAAWVVAHEGTVTDTVYTVRSLIVGKTYWFTIQAVSAGGSESAFSEPVRAIPYAAADSDGDKGRGPIGWSLSRNADLQSLEVWQQDGTPIRFDFSPAKLHYYLQTDASQIELRVSAAHAAAKVMWEKQTVNGIIAVELHEGVNVIELIVLAEDGTEKLYTVTVDRQTDVPYEPENQPDAFDDMAGHWAVQFIERAAAKSIIHGFPDGTFKPDQPVTRAQFTAMLAGALQLKDEEIEHEFTDKDRIGAWAKQAVAQAAQAGIVIGYEDGSFRPDATITRAEMAAMIARALGIQPDPVAATSFADDEAIPRWAKGAVAALQANGIVYGRGGNNFAPNETATRAEAVVMLLRALETGGATS